MIPNDRRRPFKVWFGLEFCANVLRRGDESHVRRSEPRSSFVGGGTVQPFGLTLGLQI